MHNTPRIFDRTLLRVRRRRAEMRDAANFLLERAANDVAERLTLVQRRFELALDLGTPGNALAGALASSGQIETLVSARPDPGDARLAVAADEEALPFADGAFDLVVSALALQWVNDLPGTLVQIRRALRPDGLLLAALVGGETLTELRQVLAQAEAEIEGGASPRVAPFVDVRMLGALLQRVGFALPVVDVDRHIARYTRLLDLLHDLRAMAATNVMYERRRRPLKRATLARAEALYTAKFADTDGRLRATFEVISVSGWAPDPNQQQPLRPGSARTRLADALGVEERSAGEKVSPRGRR